MGTVLSTTQDQPLSRLASIPWRALSGLEGPLSECLRTVLSGTPAERALDGLLRKLRPEENDVRRALAEAVFGVALWRRRLAWHAGVEDWRAVEPSWLFFVLMRDLAGVGEEDAANWSGLTSSAIAPPPRRSTPESWRVRESFPDWLADHLERELGADEAARFAAAINVPGPVTLRANPMGVGSRDELAQELASEGVETVPGRFARSVLIVCGPKRPNILGLRSHQRGAFEVQDEGSQLLGALVGAKPGETVLDFCAGAGGKTLQLAAEMRDQGVLHAWDVDRERLGRLEARARRAGLRSVRVHRVKPTSETVIADRVLVDAPCSELGPLRRGPDMRWRIAPDAIETLPAVQRQILEDAAKHVRPGGRLVYATCTINRAENQKLARAFEAAHPEFERLTPDVPEELVHDGFFVCLPHRHGTDGFFAAVWQRSR